MCQAGSEYNSLLLHYNWTAENRYKLIKFINSFKKKYKMYVEDIIILWG